MVMMKSRIYAYVFPKSKQASGAKDLIHTANLVLWNVILTNRSTISELVSEDVLVFGKYVPAESMKSIMKSFQAYTNLVNEGAPLNILGKVADNILAEVHTSSQYLVVEERQLTHFLKQNLLGKLPSPFIITDTQKFMSQMDRSNKLFCEYDTSKPDLCIFSHRLPHIRAN